MPAPVGAVARAPYAMKRVPSLEVSLKSRVSVAPPLIGGIGGRESLSTHMASPPLLEVDEAWGHRGPAYGAPRSSSSAVRHATADENWSRLWREGGRTAPARAHARRIATAARRQRPASSTANELGKPLVSAPHGLAIVHVGSRQGSAAENTCAAAARRRRQRKNTRLTATGARGP